MSFGHGGGSESSDAGSVELSESETGYSQSDSSVSKSQQSLSWPHRRFGEFRRGSEATDAGDRTPGGSLLSECLGCSH